MADDKKTGTEYVVLASDDGEKWESLGRYTATSEAVAKATALGALRPQGGWVVAVPLRSWKPENKQPQIRFV